MSIFDTVFAPPQPGLSPLHHSVTNARASLEGAVKHLLDALNHIGGELAQAQQEVAIHQDALANAQTRVDQFQQAAIHLATVGQSVENLLAVGQQAQTEPTLDEANVAIQEVQTIDTNAEEAVVDTAAAVGPGSEPTANV